MSNDPKTDLIYAILAMDSYNRGYGTGLTRLETGATARLGNYSIVQDIEQAGWFTAGFYAIAYRNGTDTVISYRGTDDNIGGGSRGGSDARNGYGLALGVVTSSIHVAGQIIGAINLGGALIDIGFGEDNAFNDDISLDEEGQENNVLRRTGILRVKNFDFVNSSRSTVAGSGITSSLLSGFYAATLSGQGDFNLVFRDRNLLTVVSLLQNAVKGVPILQSVFAALNALALADAAAWVGAAAGRLLEGAKWSNPDDPVVQRAARAANDNDAWPVRPFHFSMRTRAENAIASFSIAV